MGGLKRKIDTEKKIEKKEPRAVAFSKRRKGLFKKSAELCLLSDSQMAIIATPVSSKSHNAFYSFGHSSADAVVAAFLADEDDQTPDEKLGFWWEDESIANSEDREELGNAIDLMKTMLNNLEEFQETHHHHHPIDSEFEPQSQPNHQLGMDFDPIDSEFEPQMDHHVGGGCSSSSTNQDFIDPIDSEFEPQIDVHVGGGCSSSSTNQDLWIDQDLSMDDESQFQNMPMIDLDDQDYSQFFASDDFFNDIDLDALYDAS